MMNLPSLQRSFARFAVIVAILLCVSRAGAETISDQFAAANVLYEQQKFTEASAAYEKLIASGTISSSILFNLGNARFQSEEIGKAVAAFRKAQRLDPRDGDIRANLRFARDKVQNSGAAAPQESVLSRLTVNEWIVLASVPLALCFLMLAGGQLRPDLRKMMRGYVVALSVVTLLLGALAGVAVAAQSEIGAVVIAEEAVVRHGPFNESQTAFTLREGAELTVQDEREAWAQISAGPNRLGWVQKNQLEIIR